MYKLKKIFALLIVLSAVLSGLPAMAAEDAAELYNSRVAAKAAQMEQKYGVTIKYPGPNPNYVGIGPGTLNTMDSSLDKIGPALVKRLSAWSREYTGRRLVLDFTFRPSFDHIAENALAGYTPELSLMEFVVPTPGSNSFISGCTPIAITHEFGHLFYEFIVNAHRGENLRQNWSRLNGQGYSGRFVMSTHASSYAAVTLEEDFAETFAFALIMTRPGLSMSARMLNSQGGDTRLGLKVKYLETLIRKYTPEAADTLENIAKSRNVKSSAVWNGMSFSGTSLEFMGYTAPHNVIKPLLRYLGITAAKTPLWEPEIGGWDVAASGGRRYLVFPSGSSAELA
ncbi:MAG: hypothetical protein FWH02_05975 [Oscillospiraceae bacterium]|nr:hypothetical protein [Oscillospiraceae bacterium]